jgi:hypothetical protein
MEKILKQDIQKLIDAQKEAKKARDQSFITSQQNSFNTAFASSLLQQNQEARPAKQENL